MRTPRAAEGGVHSSGNSIAAEFQPSRWSARHALGDRTSRGRRSQFASSSDTLRQRRGFFRMLDDAFSLDSQSGEKKSPPTHIRSSLAA